MKAIELLRRHRNPLLFVAALGLGGLAAFGTRGYIAGQLAIERERLVPRQPMAQVVVAKRDLPRGEVVSADTMAVREVPRDYLPATSVPPERFDALAGARLAQPMRAGEPLVQGVLEAADPSAFSARVRSGIRAITISVDEVNSMSGMLQPGDRIDLLLSVRLPAGGPAPLPQELTRPLMQDLRVLATGRQVRPGGESRQERGFTAITVEVTPEQAQKLVVAQRSGKLTALLRNPQDRDPIAPRAMDVYGLLEMKPPPPGPAPGTPAEVIVGGHGALKVAPAVAPTALPLTAAPGATPPAAPSVARTGADATTLQVPPPPPQLIVR
jgi:pilus assembly protein CpaB